jgi:hypothetical protein
MRPRTSVPLALSCAAVALTGCGGSNLLDGSTAQDLQQSLSSVSQAVDAGECSDARKAARTGLQRVSDLPSSVDTELRSRLRTGFEELQDRIATDCTPETTTETTPTTTAPPETTTETAPVDPAPEETVPDDTTTQDTTPEDPSTTPDDGSGSGPGNGGSGGTDGSGPGGGDDGGGVGGDDSGGVVPGVDGPGAAERGVRGFEQRSKDLRKRAEKALRDWQKRAEKNLRGQG